MMVQGELGTTNWLLGMGRVPLISGAICVRGSTKFQLRHAHLRRNGGLGFEYGCVWIRGWQTCKPPDRSHFADYHLICHGECECEQESRHGAFHMQIKQDKMGMDCAPSGPHCWP